MESKNYPKILLGGPVSDHHDYCFDDFVNSIKSLSYPNFDVLLVDNSKDDVFFNKISKIFPTVKIPYNESIKVRLTDSRNLVRKKVIDGGYDYLFCLDQDVVPPKDILEKLVSHAQNIVTGIYFNTFTKLNPITMKTETRKLPILWVKNNQDSTSAVPVRMDVINSGAFIKIHMCGTGCILIHRDVLEKINFRCERYKEGVDDVFFCQDALKLGFDIYADCRVICDHLVDKRTMQWGEGDLITKDD